MLRSGYWRIFLVVFLLGLLCGCAAQQRTVTFGPQKHPETAKEVSEHTLENLPYIELLEKGDRYFAQGNMALAKLHFLQALKHKTPDEQLLVRLGNLFLKEGKQQNARDAFEEALRIKPDCIQALLGGGRIARLEGDYRAAETYLQELCQLEPDHTEAMTELAICYDSQGSYEKAEKYYLRVVELLPNQPSSQNNLGFHHLLQGDFEKAVEVLQNARKLAGQDRLIKNNLAAAYILSGKEGNGLALFENSLGKAEAFNNIGYIRMMRGELGQAKLAFLRALELNPSYYERAAKNLEYLKSLEYDQQAGQGNIIEKTTSMTNDVKLGGVLWGKEQL